MTEPASAASNPATMRSAVVLPQPDGPSRARNSPGAMFSDSPSSARTVPNERLRSCMATGAPASAAIRAATPSPSAVPAVMSDVMVPA